MFSFVSQNWLFKIKTAELCIAWVSNILTLIIFNHVIVDNTRIINFFAEVFNCSIDGRVVDNIEVFHVSLELCVFAHPVVVITNLLF